VELSTRASTIEGKRQFKIERAGGTPALPKSCVADAAAEGGDGFFFVGERGNGIDEAGELEDFADVADRVENFEAAALALESDEGAHEGADAGAVHLRDACEVDDDVGRASVGELAQLDVESVVAGTNGDAALQIQNGDRAGFALRDLQTHFRLLIGGRKSAAFLTWHADKSAHYTAVGAEASRNRGGECERARDALGVERSADFGIQMGGENQAASTSQGGWVCCWNRVVIRANSIQQPGLSRSPRIRFN